MHFSSRVVLIISRGSWFPSHCATPLLDNDRSRQMLAQTGGTDYTKPLIAAGVPDTDGGRGPYPATCCLRMPARSLPQLSTNSTRCAVDRLEQPNASTRRLYSPRQRCAHLQPRSQRQRCWYRGCYYVEWDFVKMTGQSLVCPGIGEVIWTRHLFGWSAQRFDRTPRQDSGELRSCGRNLAYFCHLPLRTYGGRAHRRTSRPYLTCPKSKTRFRLLNFWNGGAPGHTFVLSPYASHSPPLGVISWPHDPS